MTYSELSPIAGNQTGITASQAPEIAARINAWLGGSASTTLRDYVRTVIEQGLALGIDPFIVLGQSRLETDGWTSQWWKERINPAGIGITGDPDQNAKSQTWVSGHDAAMAHLAHLTAYLWGLHWQAHWNIDAMGLPSTWDHRFNLALESGYKAVLLKDLANTWSANDPTYGAKIASRANKIVEAIADEANTPASVPEGETVDMPITFGLVPKPKIVELIVKKTAPGYGYDICPPRHNVAGVAHETQGDPPGEGLVELRWYQQFFSCPNGERCGNGGSIDGALVDFCIARDGTIAMFNDPFGTRAGYANGGGTPASGNEGKKWIARFGSAARNTKMWSCEFIKADNARLTQAQIVSGGKLFAWMSDLDQQPWTDYPYVAKYDGCKAIFNHNEVANTSCQQYPDNFAALVAAVKSELKQYQGGSATTPAPTPDIAPGVDQAVAARLFGMVQGEDGKTYKFDPDGPVSKLWLARAKQSGDWPPLAEIWTYADGRRFFRFADGSLILARPNVDPVWVKAAA